MHTRPRTPPPDADWAEALSLDRLHNDGPTATRLRGRQVALFAHGDQVFACNNRCPHEGYPLCEGHLAADGVLTCQWHNWKFDLASGANLYGGDALRTYPTRVVDGTVWVDLAEPPAEARIAQALARLDEARDDHDPPRIARELARLERAGGSAETALAHTIVATHERLRYGMTHAYAAAEAWLRLHDNLTDPAQRLACGAEALAYIGLDTLREPIHPFAAGERAWSPADFLAAIEAQDEASAAALLRGAVAAGISVDAMEPTLAAAALAHYNDFGHSLIYLAHAQKLTQRLDASARLPLLLAWLRSLVHATREDLLPDFKAYAPALAEWPRSAVPASDGAARVAAASSRPAPDAQAVDAAAFEGLSVRATLAVTLAAARRHGPTEIWPALMEAGAHHLLRFDERLALRTDNAVTDEVGWLDFSHALTFGLAVHEFCSRTPALWPQGLLQMALFVGRNTPHLRAGLASADAAAAWRVVDVDAFDAEARAQIIDHGIGLPIFPAHWLKTSVAVRDSIALGVPAGTAAALRAALRRLLAVNFKQRHALRNATQALKFVERE
jgi:nitrite reductase/ring-hydroxylating ferredoxin subunit